MNVSTAINQISVIMPVYNCERFLGAAIESILDQTYSDFDFIIVEDGSTDGSLKIIERYLKDKRIKLIKNPERLHISKCLNLAIEASQAKYIARMDADDISEKSRLEKQVNFMNRNPHIVLLGTQGLIIDKDGEIKGCINKPVKDLNIRARLMKNNAFIHGSIMIRRDVIVKVGMYSNDFPRAEDYALWIKVIKKGRVANLPEPLYRWRVYPSERVDNKDNMNYQEASHDKIVEIIKKDKSYSFEQAILKLIELNRNVRHKNKSCN